MRRDLAVALSLANLVYLRAWADLIPGGAAQLFYRKTMPGFGVYFGLVADVLLLSLALFAVLRAAPKMPRWLQRLLPVGAAALLLLGTVFLRTQLAHYVSMRALAAAAGIGFCAAAVWMLRFPDAAARAVRAPLLAALPCLAITFLGPLYYLTRPSPLPPDPPLAPSLPGRPQTRVLWVVFDDWDQRLTFRNPDQAVPVPSLFYLEAHSFAATHALAAQTGVPVVNMATTAAIPSLLYGKNAAAAELENPSTDHLLFGDGSQTVFGADNSVFARFRALGFNAAAAGWYLPYCRVFASQLTSCYWDVRYDQATSIGSPPVEAAADATRMLFETEGYSLFGRSLVTVRHLAEYQALLDAGKREAADPALGLAYVHFNVPHPPFFDGERGPGDPYLRELSYVDRAVRELMEALRVSGLDRRTAVILTSDHPARLVTPTDPHVPLLVHFPNEQNSMVLDNEITALRIGSLAVAIAAGEVQNPEQTAHFLSGR
ncbi:MAG TPA: sulfatase-like hydrolase/transferase [Bryobacteraceae bacterium]|nr:sulfatase-like hydrolase/transferase [Bryobacteraceae bacterium]